MRILHVSDLHYSLPKFDWVVKVCPSFDMVVIAGDSLNVASTVPLDTQIVVVLRFFSMMRASTRLVVCSGNHDLSGPDAHGEQSALWLAGDHVEGVTTDGASLRAEDALVTVLPWWDGPEGREAVVTQMAADAGQRRERWVWVYHWPPLGSPTCWTGRRDYGDTDLGGWIDQFRPDIVLTGHVHQAPFTPDGSWDDRIGDTWVFNAGRQIGPFPTHIELDLATDRATWYSMMGTEELALSDQKRPARTVF